MKKSKIILLKETCGWCGKKMVGQDESGFKACVNCEYNSDRGQGNYKLSTEERFDRSWAIYKALNCPVTNPNVRFTCCCSKLKGHKGKHRDKEHPDFTWED